MRPPLTPKAQISSSAQRVAAVVATRDFLLRLSSPHATPRIPREVRREARALLRHYPLAGELREILNSAYSEKSGESS